jgi:hypothetical protein
MERPGKGGGLLPRRFQGMKYTSYKSLSMGDVVAANVQLFSFQYPFKGAR